MTPARARSVHLVVAVVAWAAVVVQLVLVLLGSAVLVEEDPPGRAESVYRFLAYFTIQSNLLVGITVTGLVHFFLLRPLLDLDGADWFADTLLHMVVPVLALAAWTLVGPRPRIGVREAAYALCWPLAWLVWTLVVGEVDGWVPYRFLDADAEGWAAVAVVSVGITALFLLLFGAFGWLDRTLAAVPAPQREADHA